MAKKTKRKRRTSKKQWKKQLKFEITGLILFTIGLLSLFQLGRVGDITLSLFRFLAGEWHIIINIAVLIIAATFIVKRSFPRMTGRRMMGLYLALLTFLLLSHVKMFENLQALGEFQQESALVTTWDLFILDPFDRGIVSDLGGGMIGALLFIFMYFLFDMGGTRIVSILLFLLSFLLITGLSIQDVMRYVKEKSVPIWKSARKKVTKWSDHTKEWLKQKKQPSPQPKENKRVKRELPTDEREEPAQEPIIYNFAEDTNTLEEEPATPSKPKQSLSSTADQKEEKSKELEFHLEEKNNEPYELPSISLLRAASPNQEQQETRFVSRNARKLEETLHSFGVHARVNEVHVGPAVTKYEVQPNTGVKVSKIVNLADDLALALAAKDIRMEAPIPGKAAIGIEVPNQSVSMVTLREVLESAGKENDHVLSVALGRDISGEPVMASLNKMPHLLVAGATGSGKSVCINGMITSILMKARPNEVKMMMIDPKMVELNVYNGIPHLLAPVVTDPKKAAQALKKVVAEMERRYELFSESGTRNMEGYNQLIQERNKQQEEKERLLPYIIVIVDELADLMMVASSDVEDAITRLAQMARAAGIHMIIATQRPSVDVITGVIKANIPSRIAFGVSSQTDSRTILDAAGAEKLLGKGDMLYHPVGANKSTRIQGAFVSDEEVERVVEAVIAQQKASYEEEMIPEDEPEIEEEVEDELYPEAVDLVLHMQSASVSMLQRRFRIGYTRAARLIDEMERRGVVGPYEGSKPRKVLLSKEQENDTPSIETQ